IHPTAINELPVILGNREVSDCLSVFRKPKFRNTGKVSDNRSDDLTRVHARFLLGFGDGCMNCSRECVNTKVHMVYESQQTMCTNGVRAFRRLWRYPFLLHSGIWN